MRLAAEHGEPVGMRIVNDALHQAGLADAGLPFDHKRRRAPLTELTDRSRRQRKLGLPSHEVRGRGGGPERVRHAESFRYAGARVQDLATLDEWRKRQTGRHARGAISSSAALGRQVPAA